MALKPNLIDYQKLIGSSGDIQSAILGPKDVSLYAVAIGFNRDPLKQEDYKYTNEQRQDFIAFPTITAVMKLKANLKFLRASPYMPTFGAHQLLHAEEKLYMNHQRIQIGVQYRQKCEVIDVMDKGKSALIILRHSAFTNNSKGVEELAFYIDRTMYIRGLGGFGFKGTGKGGNIPPTPKRAPDHIFKDGTFPSQAFVYRLCDDDNILHIDPTVSKQAGFERPIIHGMASYGIIARNLLQNLLKNNPESLKSYETRLVGHVYPGESFNINVWKDGTKIHFQVDVIQRKTKAIVGVLTTRQLPKL